MSALPPKADICSATQHVCFVPIADIPRCLNDVALPPKADIKSLALERSLSAISYPIC